MLKMTKGDLLELWKTISDLANSPAHIKFNYAILKNQKVLDNEVKTLEELSKPKEEYVTFESERQSICIDYSEKDANGGPVIENDSYKIPEEKRIDFQSKLFELRDKYLPAILAREEQVRDFEMNILNDPADIILHKIDSGFIPKTVKVGQLASLLHITKDLPEMDKVSVTYQDLLQYWNVLRTMADSEFPENFDFLMGVAVNYDVVRPMVFKLEKDHLPKEDFYKYERGLLDLRRQYADTENGVPKMMNGNFVILEKLQEFQEAAKKYDEENAATIKEREDQIKHMQDTLGETVEVELVTMDIDKFPNNLTARNLEWMFPMIKEL